MNDFSKINEYDTIDVFITNCIACRTIRFTNKFKELNILCKHIPNNLEVMIEDMLNCGTYLTFFNKSKIVGRLRTKANIDAINYLHDFGILNENYKYSNN